MRRLVVMVALASVMFGGLELPAAAQDNGIYIENNGVDVSDSAAGASNVQVSLNPGSSSMVSGGGAGNAERLATREGKERKDRSGRNNVEEVAEAVPVEAPPVEAPAEGDYQAYTDGYAEPAAAPQEAAAPVDATTVLRLPSTGIGLASLAPLEAFAAAGAAFGFGVLGIRRRMVT